MTISWMSIRWSLHAICDKRCAACCARNTPSLPLVARLAFRFFWDEVLFFSNDRMLNNILLFSCLLFPSTQSACKIMARDLVRTRRHVQKFYQMRTQLQAVSLRIQGLRSNQAMGEAMRGATRVRTIANWLLALSLRWAKVWSGKTGDGKN